MNNKKGLSAIVATLIIILLAIVAVGIVWTIIQNTVSQTGESIELNQKCLAVDLHAEKVECTGYYSSGEIYHRCDITVARGDGGDDLAGYKLIFESEESSQSFDSTEEENIEATIKALERATAEGIGVEFEPTQVKVVPYFLNEAGEEHLCTPGQVHKIQ